jgi:Superinfection immunity protein
MIATLLTAVVLAGLFAASLALYLLPVLIGVARRVPDLGSVAVINVLLGWTLLGWVAALALALRSAAPSGPVVQLVQSLPPAPPPVGQLPSAGWAGAPGPPPRRFGEPPPLSLPYPAGPGGGQGQE